uniref:Uncharacterized protein n=1 Tax=Lepeophtheirus salmonis TaxID=72036 RepID=A0A0K2SVP7_LEPSM
MILGTGLILDPPQEIEIVYVQIRAVCRSKIWAPKVKKFCGKDNQHFFGLLGWCTVL